MDKRELIFSVTQAVLAVIVVVGAGALMLWSDVDVAALTGVVGAVIGYFFGSAVSPVARGIIPAEKKD